MYAISDKVWPLCRYSSLWRCKVNADIRRGFPFRKADVEQEQGD